MNNHITERICNQCGNPFPLTSEHFVKDRRNPQGFMTICKSCRNAAKKKYDDENRERVREQKRQSHYRNRDKNNTRAIQWYHDHKDRERGKHREHYRKNKAPYFAAANARIHRKRANGGYFTKAEINDLYDEQAGMCFYCLEPLGNDYHKDHHIPVSKGGSNYIDNIVLACPSCNLSKGDKLPTEWKGRFAE